MRLKADRRGQIRIFEAFFAALLIVSVLFMVSMTPPTHEDHRIEYLTSVGTQVLLQLDRNGTLSELIEGRNWTALRHNLQTLLPTSLWFNLTVFDEDMNTINNDALISNGGPVSEEIASIEYVCASANSNYRIYVVRLQLAEAE